MDDGLAHETDPTRRARLLERLDSMVDSGRLTADEAEGLRAAAGPEEFEEVVRGISLRHAQTRLDSAVEDGSMTRDEAEGFRERLRTGEHPRSLRAHLAKFRRPSSGGAIR